MLFTFPQRPGDAVRCHSCDVPLLLHEIPARLCDWCAWLLADPLGVLRAIDTATRPPRIPPPQLGCRWRLSVVTLDATGAVLLQEISDESTP